MVDAGPERSAGSAVGSYVVENAAGASYPVAQRQLRQRVFVKQAHAGVTGVAGVMGAGTHQAPRGQRTILRRGGSLLPSSYQYFVLREGGGLLARSHSLWYSACFDVALTGPCQGSRGGQYFGGLRGGLLFMISLWIWPFLSMASRTS
jgi:hypothetical protein